MQLGDGQIAANATLSTIPIRHPKGCLCLMYEAMQRMKKGFAYANPF